MGHHPDYTTEETHIYRMTLMRSMARAKARTKEKAKVASTVDLPSISQENVPSPPHVTIVEKKDTTQQVVPRARVRREKVKVTTTTTKERAATTTVTTRVKAKDSTVSMSGMNKDRHGDRELIQDRCGDKCGDKHHT